jgi:ricin-type beta-trefoil lectin protein
VKSVGNKKFEASVQNITANWSVKLGTVTTGADSIRATDMSGWLEYFDWNNPATTCQSQPYSQALMFLPTGVGIDNKSYVATISGTHASTTCVPYTRISTLATFTRHENGVGNTILGGIFYGANSARCVAFSGGNAMEGAAIVLSNCRSGQSQAWVLAVDGTLRSPSLLFLGVSAPSGVAGNGALAQLQRCTGSNNQKWSYDPVSGALKNALANRCLEPTPMAATGDSRLQVRDCNGAATQKWIIPRRK